MSDNMPDNIKSILQDLERISFQGAVAFRKHWEEGGVHADAYDINDSFTWADTPEGWKFWSTLYNRIRYGEQYETSNNN